MNIGGYKYSNFYDSMFCNCKARLMQCMVVVKMYYLAEKSIVGNIAARIASPFVGGGTLLASLCLRIAGVIEPIIGFFADIGVAICTGDKDILNNSIHHEPHREETKLDYELDGPFDV